MMTVDLYTKQGKKKGTLEVPAALAATKINPGLVHQSVVREMANARQGNAATKTRGLVSGGGIKPWRQKGTGRARAGSNRSPLWVGGGTTFGPQPRSYEKKMNKKMRYAAVKSAVLDKINQGCLKVVEDFELTEAKTKLFLAMLKEMAITGSVLIVVDKENRNLELSARNVKDVKMIPVSSLNTFEILKYQEIVMTPEALQLISAKGGENAASA